MKTKHFLSSAALIALSICAASCSTDEPATENSTTGGEQTVTFTGGFDDAEGQLTRVWLDDSENNLTRVTMARNATNAVGTFSWETSDYLWIKDSSNKYQKTNNATQATSSKFTATGLFGNSAEVLYKGTGSGSTSADNKVTIQATQTQSAFNNTNHLKTSGACAIGTATKANGTNYNFSLTHKTAYLCLLPYTTDADFQKLSVKSVKVSSTANLAGTYTLSSSAGLSGGSNKTITLNVTSGSLSGVTTQNISKSLYMVVAPGNHTLTVVVTLSDGQTVTKTYSAKQLEAGKVYNVPLNILRSYPLTWGLMTASKVPNPNVMTWYLAYGDPYKDTTTKYLQNGQEYTGGYWFKKLQVIATEKKTTTSAMQLKDVNGNDLRQANVGVYTKTPANDTPELQQAKNKAATPKNGKPSNLSNYFFVPNTYNFWCSDQKASNNPTYIIFKVTDGNPTLDLNLSGWDFRIDNLFQ